MSKSINGLKRFLRDERGNFAMMFAVGIIPIALSAGIAVDYSMASRYDGRLQSAIDAATLAAGTEMPKKSDKQVKKIVQDYLRANLDADDYAQLVGATRITIDRKTMKLTVEADGKMKTGFGGIVGIKKINYGGIASIQAAWGSIEAVMVLDNTGSMLTDDKLGQLKIAATDFVEEMTALNTTSNRVKIGIVPFSEYVNVGVDNRDASWISVPADSTSNQCYMTQDVVSKSGCHMETGTGTNEYGPYSYDYEVCTGYTYGPPHEVCGASTSTWFGCAGSRDYPLNMTDGNFGNRVPGVLDGNSVNYMCPSRLTELTADKPTLLAEIDKMQAVGETYIPAGLSWGQRVLSSKEPFIGGVTPAKAKSDNVTKAIVLMTDGANTLSKDPGGPYHYVYGDVSETNTWTLESCAAIKKEGTKIYAMAFGKAVPAETATMMQTCSSGTGYYFNATDGAALKTAFGDIAASLTKLYLTQ